MTFGKLIIILGAVIVIVGIIYEFTSFFSIFETNSYDFKFNIRNKQGGIYPTHTNGDYYKK